MTKTFEIGEPYFLLSYVDKDFKYPEISTMVFIGKNLEDGEEELWFFQDAESYVECGAYPNMRPGNREATVADFPETQLDRLLTIKELATAL